MRTLLVAISLPAFALAQQSAAFFDAPIVQLPADSPPFQQLFDYDGDGDMDAVGSRVRQDGLFYDVRVWRNDLGRFVQVFGEVQPAVGGTGTNAPIAIGDFDLDGDPDFALGTGSNYWIYRNQNGAWPRLSFAAPQKVGDLAAGDFDGDGLVDLAISGRTPAVNPPPGFVRIRFGNGSTWDGAMPSELPLYTRIEVLQADGDAADELGLWYVTRSEFQLFDWTGGALAPVTVWNPAVTAPDRWCYWSSGDVDGDGDTDVLAFELPTLTAAGRVHCFRRVGVSTFSSDAAYFGGPAEFLADADGDGDLDGVCCGGGTGSPPTWPLSDFGSMFEIAINDGAGNLAPSFRIPSIGSRRMAGVADLDLDGDVDLVAGAVVYYARGPLTAAITPSVFDPAAGFESEAWSRRLQWGDFDRDGDPDLVPNLDARAVNTGDGSFPPSSVPPVNLPAGLEVRLPRFRGDFDADGAPDFIVPLFQTVGGAFSHMAKLLNNGSGRLLYAGAAAPAGQQIGQQLASYHTMATSPLVADLDGDGDLDILVGADAAYEQPYHCELWWNQGGAQFVAGPGLPTERTEAVADFDGDGHIDYVVRAGWNAPLQLRLGTGNPLAPWGPALAQPPAIIVDLEVESVLVVDANDDGRPDLIARGYQATLEAQFVLFCNTTTAPGAPSFQAAAGVFPLTSYYRASSVSVFDVDGDGRSDLVHQGQRGSGLTSRVHRRLTGDGQVLQASDFAPAVGHATWMGFPADADGDGDPDLVGTFTVRNLRHHGPTAAQRRQFGTGTAGEAGSVPLLGVGGSLRQGGVAEMRLSGITGPTVAVLAIGVAPANLPGLPLPGMTLLLDPASAITGVWVLPAAGGGEARGSAILPVWLPPGTAGFEFWDQVFVFDPAAANGFAASNGLRKRIGS